MSAPTTTPAPAAGAVRDDAVVFIAPPSQRPLLAALMDLSSAGLLAPFHWLESVPEPEADRDFRDPLVVRVNEGRTSVLPYSRAVNRYGLATVRLIVVVPVGHPAADALSATAELHYQGLGITAGAVRRCLRVLVPWSEDPAPAELGHQGWNNVMLSPESTADPAYSANGWWQSPEIIPGAAAVGLAAQAGICGAVTRAPMDERPAAGSTYVEVTRTFVRVTDAHAVEDGLRDLVTDVGVRYPQPVWGDTRQWVHSYPDPGERVLGAARTWHQRHQSALRRPLARPPARTVRTVGAWQAITMFFSFLGRTLVGAPADWLRSLTRAIKATAARSVERTVFGEGSQVRVVVGGVDDTGRPAGWRELAAAAAGAGAAMPEQEFGGASAGAVRDFGALWQDLLDGSFALLGGSGCENLGLTPYEGYVPDRDAVAPALSGGQGRFTIDQDIGDVPAGTVLNAWDALEIDRVARMLQQAAASQDARARAAREHLGRLEQWKRSHERRFIPLLGRSLATTFNETRESIVSIERELRTLVGQNPGPALERQQSALARILRTGLIILLLVILTPVILALLKAISWKTVVLIVTFALVVWFVVSIWIFVRRQQEVFQLLQRTEEGEQRIPLLTANLRLAVEDLAAQGAAYSQFDAWAAVVTVFLADPLGERDTVRTAREHETVLPESLQRVVVEADPGHVNDVAAELRSRVFQVGWLREAWGVVRAAVKDDLTPDQRTRLKNRQLSLFTESGEPGSALRNWADALMAKGVRSSAGADRWSRCLELLGDSDGPRLDLRVPMSDGSWRLVSDYRRDLEAPTSRSVVTDVLGPVARSGGSALTAPAGHWFCESRDGLSETMLLADSTAPLAPAAFIYPEPECAGPVFRLDEPDYMEGIRAAGPTVEPGTAPSDPPAGPSGLLEY